MYQLNMSHAISIQDKFLLDAEEIAENRPDYRNPVRILNYIVDIHHLEYSDGILSIMGSVVMISLTHTKPDH
jgi:hypothetical protein